MFETLGEIEVTVILATVVLGVSSSMILASPVADSSIVSVFSVNCPKADCKSGGEIDCQIKNIEIRDIAKVSPGLFETEKIRLP